MFPFIQYCGILSCIINVHCILVLIVNKIVQDRGINSYGFFNTELYIIRLIQLITKDIMIYLLLIALPFMEEILVFTRANLKASILVILFQKPSIGL